MSAQVIPGGGRILLLQRLKNPWRPKLGELHDFGHRYFNLSLPATLQVAVLID